MNTEIKVIVDSNGSLVRRGSLGGFVSTSDNRMVTMGKIVSMSVNTARDIYGKNFSMGWGLSGDDLSETVTEEIEVISDIANTFGTNAQVKLNKSSVRQISYE